jgi:2-polyprenyl-3-methyl-5-hydroxy-6-metoxy-1,4-benzoquinol methylase
VSTYTYAGSELDLFASSRRWKTYWRSHVNPFISGDVLEVGAGIGSNTLLLCDPQQHRWTCLEPDASLASRAGDAVAQAGLRVRVVVGTTRDLVTEPMFDAVLYLDVLEHIADDRAELSRAAGLLRIGGHLSVLAPAHPALFSRFDRFIGHHRRYSRRALTDISPSSLQIVQTRYLDTAGLAVSLANRFGLRQTQPTAKQIEFWDRTLVPMSQRLDRWLHFRCGKTVLAVWEKRSP